MSQEEPWHWHVRMRQALIQTFKDVNGDGWGYDPGNNAALVIDMVEEFEKMSGNGLQLQKRQVMPYGIEVYVTIGDVLTSLPEIFEAIYALLHEVREQFIAVIPILDNEALRYWFAIGSRTHGNIGEIIILRENLSHIDISSMEIDPKAIDDLLAWKKDMKEQMRDNNNTHCYLSSAP